MREIRRAVCALWMCALLLPVITVAARADVKTDMCKVVDTLSKGGAAGEAVIDWDNLDIRAPQTKGMDIKAMYKQMPPDQKKQFRAQLVKSFSDSFRKAANGHTMLEAAKAAPKMLQVTGKEPMPGLNMSTPNGVVHLGFVRKSGKLLLNKMAVDEKK